jgi:NAD(P)-dependent dehydrogenase (short-subunit alcohol dehydrogenase family)
MDKSTGGHGGTVVNVGSIAGLGQGMVLTPIYDATKHGVVGLSRAFGVRIIVLSFWNQISTVAAMNTVWR